MKFSDKDVLTCRIAERVRGLFQNKRTGENIPHIILFKGRVNAQLKKVNLEL